MKKVIIGAVIAAAIGTGAYFGKDYIGGAAGDVVETIGNTAGDVAETQVTDFINENLNKPLVIKELQSHPFIKTATITIKEKKDNNILSEIHIVTVEEGENFVLPLNSEIIRGKAEYNGENFGFGKIITKPDLSKFEELPKFINNDSFTLTQYIDLTGNVSEVYSAKPFNEEQNGDKINFKGAEVIIDTQLLDRSAFDGKAVFNGLEVTGSDDKVLNMSKISYDIKLDKSGNYTGSSEAFDFLISEYGNNFQFAMGKGTFTGIHKSIDGLNMPISNLDSSFESVTLGDEKAKFTINDLKLAAGLYEAGDTTDLKLSLNGDFDTASLPTTLPNGKPFPLKLKSFSFSYGFAKLSKETINKYGELVNSLQLEGGLPDEQSQALVSSLQKSDANFKLALNVTAEEGSADANLSFAMNEQGKSATVEQLMMSANSGASLAKLVNGDLHVTMDKAFADATELSMAAQMFLGISAENDKLVLQAELKDGTATMNGKPVPLP